MNILISNPSSTNITFIPYIYGVLKQHSDRDLDLRRSCNWLEPIFLRDEPAVLTSPYRLDEVDILGLSCYVWNFKLQCEIARLTKERNPNCLVVAGGPEPDWNDASWVAQRWLEVLPIPVEQKQWLVAAKDNQPALSLLSGLLVASH